MVRAHVEREGRVELQEAEAATLMRSKVAHVCALAVVVPAAVAMASKGHRDDMYYVPYRYTVVAFWLAGLFETVPRANSLADACKDIGKVTMKVLLGYWGAMAVVLFAYFVLGGY